jgi:hypothetical protein
MAFRFEFDPVDKILLGRIEGRLTHESAIEIYQSGQKYSISTDANAAILDFSLVTEFPISSESLRQLAPAEPAMPDAKRPRFVVATDTCIRPISHVSDHRRTNETPPDSSAYH